MTINMPFAIISAEKAEKGIWFKDAWPGDTWEKAHNGKKATNEDVARHNELWNRYWESDK